MRMPKAMHTTMSEIARRELSSLNREVLIACRAHIDAHKHKRGNK